MYKNSQRGQAVLIIILVMVVAVTVGLSIASRSVTNLRTATEEENSQRAYSAAQAGIEKALLSGCATPTPNLSPVPCPAPTLTNNVTVNTSISVSSGAVYIISNGVQVTQDGNVDVWLAPQNSDGTINYASPDNTNWNSTSGSGSKVITVYWGKPSDVCVSGSSGTNSMAALEIDVFTGDGTKLNTGGANPSLRMDRYVTDPCSGAFGTRASVNGFNSGVGTLSVSTSTDLVNGQQFGFKAVLPDLNTLGQSGVVGRDILLRMTPLYASTPLAVVSGTAPAGTGGKPFPTQGNVLTATGISGGAQRVISYFRQYSCPSQLCQYSLLEAGLTPTP